MLQATSYKLQANLRFQVPQFIETETKIVGPFTIKQFLWLGGGGAVLVVFYMLLPKIIFFVVALPVSAVFVAFAYVKIDNISLFNYAVYALSFALNPKRYLFKKEEEVEVGNVQIIEEHRIT